jgi:hypothetical protein
MSPRVLEPSAEELRARRERLLARLGRSRESLEAAADAGQLTSEEFWLWEDLRDVEFLLGDDGVA